MSREIKFKYVVESDEEVYVSRPFSLKEIEETNNIFSDISDDFPKEKFQELYIHGKIVDKLQYTGIKDISGVEIYEGDIIKRCTAIHTGNAKEYSIGDVYYQAPCFVVRAKFEFSDSKFVPLANPRCNNKNFTRDEVIGNIYENKELLNV